ncbi:MAG: low specificity L-threonine aldolase [Oscillospiraceae bacterium]|nr:low specificity L-threonine aldolase [Oscillospiraceae bacterium]
MDRLLLASDYQEGAHPAVLRRLAETNMEKTSGYGTDEFCAAAGDKIRAACGCPDAAVHFLVGGTQTNATVIDALLGPCQGVIAPESGHISTHEAGAIEFGGHKVLALPQSLGKLDAETIRDFCSAFFGDQNREHMVEPGMVYVSQPTEFGTLYSLSELTAISEVCREYSLRLYLDGARLAYALACEKNDVSLSDIARLCDAFYIGGTKCGALFGEAVVIPDPKLLPRFFTITKQHGALLAKGRLLGVQFDALFTDGLYMEIGRSAILAADRMREAVKGANFCLALDSPTNQVFLLLENSEAELLSESVDFSFWERRDASHIVVRLAASWATTPDEADRLGAVLRRIKASAGA